MARILNAQPLTDQNEINARFEKALREAVEFKQGKDNGTKTEVYEVEIDEVTAVRWKVGLSQEAFAEKLGISVATLRNWEQGRRTPTGPARVLLDIIDRRPDVLDDRAAKKRRPAMAGSGR